MDWLKNVTNAVAVAVVAGFIGAWLGGVFNEFVWSPGRTLLGAANLFRAKQEGPEDRFRFVLCWLQNDKDGKDTRIVAQAFRSIQGVSLVRSAQVVEASGAADDWRPDMLSNARAVLERWNADLAVVGVVKEPGKVLSLWFVTRTGDGTLERGDEPYVLKDATLGKDFHDDLQAQLAAAALTAVTPLADTTVRRRVLRGELRTATEKLNRLVRNSARRKAEVQAAMEAGLSTALVALGKPEIGTELFERAVTGYRAALQIFTLERHPEQWAHAMNDLGVALVALAERETGSKRLEEAVSVYRGALEERTRGRAPLAWAMTQNNLGVALATIGERESSTIRLEEAIIAYRAALGERTRDREALVWAATQNNLANALVRLYKLQGEHKHLDEGIATYRLALEERTRNRVPLQWAHTQRNLGGALIERGKRDKSNEDLIGAVTLFRAVLGEHTRERLPMDWAATQIGLGAALRALAEQEQSANRLADAVDAYRAALQVLSPEESPLAWAMAQNNLGNALRKWAAYENSTARLKEASQAYQSALNVLNAGGGSARFRDEVEQLLEHTLRELNDRQWQQ